MSRPTERFRSATNTLRTRLVMAGVFVGALLALASNSMFSWSGDSYTGGGGGGRSEAAAAARKAAFSSPPGSCLAWDKVDAGDARVVPCAQAHRFEVTEVVDITDRYPKGAPSPDLVLWRQIAQERCTEGAKEYLGKPLDPFGKLSVNMLRPDEDQWAAGDRQLRCGLQWAGPGGGLQKMTGPAKDQEQSNVWEPGTCLALNGKTVGDPIDCSRPHSYEIVATLDLKSEFKKSAYPSTDDQKTWLDTECSKAIGEYATNPDLAAQKLILTWDLREKQSWEAKSTLVNCKIAALLPDGSGLAPVTGSLKKAPPAPPSAPGATPTQGPPPPGGAPVDGAPADGPPADGPPADGQPSEGPASDTPTSEAAASPSTASSRGR
jgi:hypothetical protein